MGWAVHCITGTVMLMAHATKGRGWIELGRGGKTGLNTTAAMAASAAAAVAFEALPNVQCVVTMEDNRY